jgi:LEA14-like dessication related protein
MMKKLVLIPLIAILLMFQGCLKPESPEISYQDAEFKLVSFTEVDAGFNFVLDNPNSVPLKGIVSYKLNLDGDDFLSGESDEIAVNSQDKAAFTIHSKIDLIKFFGTTSKLLQAVAQGKKEIPYRFEGSYKTQAMFFPVEVPFVVQGAIPITK